jgi:hypothetical protein
MGPNRKEENTFVVLSPIPPTPIPPSAKTQIEILPLSAFWGVVVVVRVKFHDSKNRSNSIKDCGW